MAAAGSPVRAAIHATTDFEGGSAQVLELDAAAQRIRITPAGDPKRGMPNWWCLRLDGVDTNRPVVLEVTARDVTVPGSDSPDQSLSPGWTLPERAAISLDGVAWNQTAPGERNGSASVYRTTNASPALWLAWGPPFVPHDAAAFVERMAREHSFATAFTLAKSREGRAVPALQISEGDLPSTNRPAVWIVARHHAWECGGSWVSVGLVGWLLSDDARALRLRRGAEIVVVPVMDVDHVATGDGGKYALPQDHIRDWSASPHWPEIAAAQQRIRAVAAQQRRVVFLDLHNGSPGQTVESFYLPHPPYIGEETARLQERFFDGARRAIGEIKLMDGIPARAEELPVWRNNASPWVREQCGPRTVAFTVETPWNTPQSTPAGYREVGRKLGLTVEEYLREP